MENFEDYLQQLENDEQRTKLRTLFQQILTDFPELGTRIAWNEPMFTHHDTFIIGFSTAKNHFSVSPEVACLKKFLPAIEKIGYGHTNNIFRIKWNEAIDYALIKDMIAFNIEDKAEYTKFWR
ncbi:MAG: iron chaperone [Enterococcus hulanensis]